VLAKQQKQQAQRVAAAVPAVVRGASSSAQVVRAGQGAGAGAFAPSSDHPLAAAVQNSSRLLAAKLQVRYWQLPKHGLLNFDGASYRCYATIVTLCN
jgi:hypothetical protein